jgi:hypothetical protein
MQERRKKRPSQRLQQENKDSDSDPDECLEDFLIKIKRQAYILKNISRQH